MENLADITNDLNDYWDALETDYWNSLEKKNHKTINNGYGHI